VALSRRQLPQYIDAASAVMERIFILPEFKIINSKFKTSCSHVDLDPVGRALRTKLLPFCILNLHFEFEPADTGSSVTRCPRVSSSAE
jgi:hypothetical protein